MKITVELDEEMMEGMKHIIRSYKSGATLHFSNDDWREYAKGILEMYIEDGIGNTFDNLHDMRGDDPATTELSEYGENNN